MHLRVSVLWNKNMRQGCRRMDRWKTAVDCRTRGAWSVELTETFDLGVFRQRKLTGLSRRLVKTHALASTISIDSSKRQIL